MKIFRGQHGYTLVELLVSIAIAGLIFSVVGGVIFQLSTVSDYGNDVLTANHELENTAFWFNLDAQSALEAAGGSDLTLACADGKLIIYKLSGRVLERHDNETTITLARNIEHAAFNVQGRVVTMNIVSAPGGRSDVSEQRSYKVFLRAGG